MAYYDPDQEIEFNSKCAESNGLVEYPHLVRVKHQTS